MIGHDRHGNHSREYAVLIQGSREDYRVCRYLLFVLLSFALGGCAVYTATSGQVVLKDDSQAVEVRFTADDRAAVQSYYQQSWSRNNVWPRINIVVGKALPSGTRGEPLPRDLEQKLSPLPSSYVRLRVGRDIVLLEKQTRMVRDILRATGS